MNIVQYRDWRGNFGDDLNEPFFDVIAPNWRDALPGHSLLGIGTLLNESRSPFQDTIVFGSGFGQGSSVEIAESTIVCGVRGYKTANALKLADEKLVIGDPALEIPYISEFNRGVSLSSAPIVVGLHHRTAEIWDFSDASGENIYFLDPGSSSVYDYIATIRQAKYVVCEAMHAAITAIAYGKPVIPISIGPSTDMVKWTDFLESVGIDQLQRHQVDAPDSTGFRKYTTALAKRGLGTRLISREGVSLTEDYRNRICIQIDKLLQNSACLVASDVEIKKLKKRREESIFNLNRILNKE